MNRDPHDLRKSDIEDAAIDGEHVPRISVNLWLCPVCGRSLEQEVNSDESRLVYCRKCDDVFANGKTFDEAVARLREKVGAK